MATKLKNLSIYKKQNIPPKSVLKNKKFAIAVADWNSEITFAMLQGAIDTFVDNGVREKNIEVVHVAGAFELIYASSALQQTKEYSAIVAIGSVIRGDTPHFDYICSGVANGIASLNTNTLSPVVFSVLTTENLVQAQQRAGGIHGNKGTEGAATAMQLMMINP